MQLSLQRRRLGEMGQFHPSSDRKSTKEIQQMGEDFERDSKREIQSQQRAKPKQQQPAVVVPIDNVLSVCGGMVV